MKKENKFIKFIKKHKSGIKTIAFYTGGLFIGYGIGKYIYTHDGSFRITHERTIEILRDVTEDGKCDVDVFTGGTYSPIKPDNLGELGKAIKTLDVDNNFDDGFTHFIALRKSK